MQAENYSVGDYDGSIVDLSVRIFLKNSYTTATSIAPFRPNISTICLAGLGANTWSYPLSALIAITTLKLLP